MWKASGTETAEEAHERSARMKLSDKCKRFRILLDGGKIPNGEKVKDLLTRIEDHSMRNVFAHSFLASDEHSVTFIHRKVSVGESIDRQDIQSLATTSSIMCKTSFNSPSTSSKQSDCHMRKVADFAAMAMPFAPQDEPQSA
jgi:hypothetical protein